MTLDEIHRVLLHANAFRLGGTDLKLHQPIVALDVMHLQHHALGELAGSRISRLRIVVRITHARRRLFIKAHGIAAGLIATTTTISWFAIWLVDILSHVRLLDLLCRIGPLWGVLLVRFQAAHRTFDDTINHSHIVMPRRCIVEARVVIDIVLPSIGIVLLGVVVFEAHAAAGTRALLIPTILLVWLVVLTLMEVWVPVLIILACEVVNLAEVAIKLGIVTGVPIVLVLLIIVIVLSTFHFFVSASLSYRYLK